ncbi:uncharacterized protein METZ01_LOCUS473238, partial [marine metagenome]
VSVDDREPLVTVEGVHAVGAGQCHRFQASLWTFPVHLRCQFEDLIDY